MPKRRYLTATIVGVFALGAVWLFAMQYVSVAFDKITTHRLEAKVLPDVAWNDLYLVADAHVLDLELPDKPAVSARIKANVGEPLMLVSRGERIVLGRRTSSVISNAETIEPASVFALDHGDRLFLSVEQSWLDWPTFFLTNYMTGSTTSWRRYRYYRLTLQKTSGASAEMLWRYEEFYYPSDHAWIKGDRLCEADEPPCGLIRVRIRP